MGFVHLSRRWPRTEIRMIHNVKGKKRPNSHVLVGPRWQWQCCGSETFISDPVSDPDPAFNEFRIRFRIRIRLWIRILDSNPDPDPGFESGSEKGKKTSFS